MTVLEILKESRKLSLEERKLLAREIVDLVIIDDDSIDEDDLDDELEITPELIAELERAEAYAKAHPEKSVTWEQVQEELKLEVGEWNA